MLTDEEKAAMNSRLIAINQECEALNSELKGIKEVRESHFIKKEALRKEIDSLINDIKGTKTNNDEFSKIINDLKSQRDSYNKKVKELIIRIKELRSKRNSLSKSNPISIEGLKRHIEDLEHSIEINAYTYDKEKKISEKIKRLKKTLKENADVAKLDDELRLLSSEIDSTKKTADDLHKKLEETTLNSRAQNSSFMDLAKKISLLKQQQREEFELFKKAKLEYVEKINKLKDKRIESKAMHDKIFADRKEKVIAEKDIQKNELKKKAESVKEKLKNQGTLTKEDILILQAEDQN